MDPLQSLCRPLIEDLMFRYYCILCTVRCSMPSLKLTLKLFIFLYKSSMAAAKEILVLKKAFKEWCDELRQADRMRSNLGICLQLPEA